MQRLVLWPAEYRYLCTDAVKSVGMVAEIVIGSPCMDTKPISDDTIRIVVRKIYETEGGGVAKDFRLFIRVYSSERDCAETTSVHSDTEERGKIKKYFHPQYPWEDDLKEAIGTALRGIS